MSNVQDNSPDAKPKTVDDGGPAFPAENAHHTARDTFYTSGMSLLDYFAAHAMSAVLANHGVSTRMLGNKSRRGVFRDVARQSYELASAMVEAKKRTHRRAD